MYHNVKLPTASRLFSLFLLIFYFNTTSRIYPDQIYQIHKLGRDITIENTAQPSQLINNDKFQIDSINWSKPMLLFELDKAGEIHYPLVISDSYGNVHIFWVVQIEKQLGMIYYMKFDSEGMMTFPVDIIAADIIRALGGAIGQDGYLYLIWQDGRGIEYSRAPIRDAVYAKSWSEPEFLTDSNMSASIYTSSTGQIYLAYPGKDVSGVFFQILDPNNLNWSPQKLVSYTSLPNAASDYVQIRVSDTGTIHVVWTEFYYPDAWPPLGVFYSHSTDGGNTWSVAEMLGDGGYDQINMSIAGENIYVVWNGMAGVGGRYFRWSSDGGETWSNTAEIIPAGIGGTEGYPQVKIDQAGTVHLLTTHLGGCLWYIYYEKNRQSNPTCISGERTLVEEPSLDVSDGNKLHAVFWDDRKSLWYITKTTNAPRIPPTNVDNENVLSTSNPIFTVTPAIVESLALTGLPLNQEFNSSSKFILNSNQVLIISLLPVIILVVLIFVLFFIKKLK